MSADRHDKHGFSIHKKRGDKYRLTCFYDGGASGTIFELLSEHISKNSVDEKVLDLLLEMA